jgi:hypothetical protein
MRKKNKKRENHEALIWRAQQRAQQSDNDDAGDWADNDFSEATNESSKTTGWVDLQSWSRFVQTLVTENKGENATNTMDFSKEEVNTVKTQPATEVFKPNRKGKKHSEIWKAETHEMGVTK